ncbi:hypothetical protein RB196_09480 [Streptomyces sp. PmtA]
MGAGSDAGERHHWLAVGNEVGATAWSKEIHNEESEILTARGES